MTKQPLNILSFNHHESYLCTLAETGHQFDVITKYKKLDLSWNIRSQTAPKNFNLVHFDRSIRKKLRDGYYDVVICHTIKNLLWMLPYRNTRFIFVAHIPLFKNNIFQTVKSILKQMAYDFFAKTHHCKFLAVSEFKRNSWNRNGSVVVLAPNDLGALIPNLGYDRIAVVCNQLAQRPQELGLNELIRLKTKLPINIIGNNPGIDGSIHPANREDFVRQFRAHRIYLYTIRFPYGDGYNTAMLEAMRLGMAIVSVPNPSSPIEHGKNGLIGQTESEIFHHLKKLLDTPSLVDQLGAEAKKTIDMHFGRDKFLSGWQESLQRTE